MIPNHEIESALHADHNGTITIASHIPTYDLDNTHGVGINPNLRSTYYYTRSLWGWGRATRLGYDQHQWSLQMLSAETMKHHRL